MKTEALPEIIEIIDDGLDPFGDRVQHTTIRDSGGPRWVGPVAAAALVALIGYGVASSASTSSTPKAAPEPSTSAAPTTVPAPTTTTEPTPIVPYYSADPPRDFTVQYADIQDPDQNYYGPGNFQLWATADAGAASGSWFSVEGYASAPDSVFAMDAYRVDSRGRSIAISHLPSGQSVAQFSVKTTLTVTMTAFGFDDDELVRLAESVGAEGDDLQLTDLSLIPDFRMISVVPPWLAVQGIPTEQIFFVSSQDLVGGIGISIAQPSTTSVGGARLDRQIALRFLLDHLTPFSVDGHAAVAGSVVGQRDLALASWTAGDHIVTVSARTSVAELISVARTVHEVSAEEWKGLQFQAAARHTGDNRLDDFDQTDPQPVSFGTDGASGPWTIQVSILTFPNTRQVSWIWDGNGYGEQLEDTAGITTVVDHRRTYVLANLPRAIAPTARLQVTRAGLDPVVVPFTDIDPDLDRTFAAYAFSEPGRYTAQIIGADGAVLADWAS
jgi:hypothetical protein